MEAISPGWCCLRRETGGAAQTPPKADQLEPEKKKMFSVKAGKRAYLTRPTLLSAKVEHADLATGQCTRNCLVARPLLAGGSQVLRAKPVQHTDLDYPSVPQTHKVRRDTPIIHAQ